MFSGQNPGTENCRSGLYGGRRQGGPPVAPLACQFSGILAGDVVWQQKNKELIIWIEFLGVSSAKNLVWPQYRQYAVTIMIILEKIIQYPVIFENLFEILAEFINGGFHICSEGFLAKIIRGFQ